MDEQAWRAAAEQRWKEQKERLLAHREWRAEMGMVVKECRRWDCRREFRTDTHAQVYCSQYCRGVEMRRRAEAVRQQRRDADDVLREMRRQRKRVRRPTAVAHTPEAMEGRDGSHHTDMQE